MRLARIWQDGELRLATKQNDCWFDLARATGDHDLALSSELVRRLGREPLSEGVLEVQSFGPAVVDPRIICIGRNYVEHSREMGNSGSPWPETFLRLPSSVLGPYDPIRVPSVSSQVDYEGELGVVIGKAGRHIGADQADRYILGYTIVNDVSMRDWQKRGQQFTPGKNFDGTLPVGPEIVTADELDWRGLQLETRLNGETVQSASTDDLIFDVPTIIEFVSSWLTLEPGDLLCTGTPGGVGAARTPPLWLKPGDVVEVEIEGIGRLENPVVADERGAATDRWTRVADDSGAG